MMTLTRVSIPENRVRNVRSSPHWKITSVFDEGYVVEAIPGVRMPFVRTEMTVDYVFEVVPLASTSSLEQPVADEDVEFELEIVVQPKARFTIQAQITDVVRGTLSDAD